MMKNRLLYCAALLAVLAFYIYYYNWASEFLFFAVLFLPLFSLLVSLPAMLSCRVRITLPAVSHCGTPVQGSVVSVPGKRFPSGRLRCKVRLRELSRQESSFVKVRLCGYQKQSVRLPCTHCGCVELSLSQARIYDYLGLVWLPVKKPPALRTVILPNPEKPSPAPRLSDGLDVSLRPKRGGGSAEAHEIRAYREGDSLRDVHWKLSAKTDQLMVREAMEPEQTLYLLTFTLTDNASVNDGVLARLSWTAQRLLDEEIPFSIRYFDPETAGLCTVPIQTGDALRSFFAELLQHSVLGFSGAAVPHSDAVWHYHAAPMPEVSP